MNFGFIGGGPDIDSEYVERTGINVSTLLTHCTMSLTTPRVQDPGLSHRFPLKNFYRLLRWGAGSLTK